MSEKKYVKQIKGPIVTQFEFLRRRPDDLRLIVKVLTSSQNHATCVDIFYEILRNWNYRRIRIDRNFPGEWLWRTHLQFEWEHVAASERTSQKALNILENSGLIERRRADLGKHKNVIHIAPTGIILRFLAKVSKHLDNCSPTELRRNRLRHLCDRKGKFVDGPLGNINLVHIAGFIRDDPKYGSSLLDKDLSEAFEMAEFTKPRYPKKVTTAPSGSGNGGSSAQIGSLNDGELPNQAGIIKVKGELVEGDLEKVDSETLFPGEEKKKEKDFKNNSTSQCSIYDHEKLELSAKEKIQATIAKRDRIKELKEAGYFTEYPLDSKSDHDFLFENQTLT